METHAVAWVQQGWLRFRRIENRRAGLSQDAPASRRVARINTALAGRERDTAGRHFDARRWQARQMQLVGQTKQVREPGRKAQEGDAVYGSAKFLDDL